MMQVDLAVRTLKALAAFRPGASMADLPLLITELHDALEQFAATLTDTPS